MNTTDLIRYTVQRAIHEHFRPRTSVKDGRDITHHEPVAYVKVEMSPRVLGPFLHSDDKPTEVDGTPILYSEKPAPGVLDVSTMCYYSDERARQNNGHRGSRGWVVALPRHDFS